MPSLKAERVGILAASGQGDWPELSRVDGQSDRLLEYAFERFHRTAALFGTVDRCTAFVQRLAAVGVHEVAALIDFGLPATETLDGLRYLDQVRTAVNGAGVFN